MSKKIPVLNSPWGREFERISDCQRWISQGHAQMVGDALSFTDAFFVKAQRESLEFDPIGFDDGVSRRWVNRESGGAIPGEAALDGQLVGSQNREIVTSPGGIGVKQLLPIKHVGTGSFVTKNPDKLTGRRERQFRTLAPGSAERN